jgi:RNA polymerase sigma-70 factor (ECF subfamily)
MNSDSLRLFFTGTTARNACSSDSASETHLRQEPTDAQLMERIKLGNREALGILYERYAKIVFTVGLRILRNATEAQDLVQDIFVQIFRKCHLYDMNKGSAASWLLRIAYSKAFDRREYLNLRGWSGWSEVEEIMDRELVDASCQPLDKIILAKQVLARALSELTHRQRLTLEMYFFEGYTLREISAQLDESIINTRHHYYRGIEKLRAVALDHRADKVLAD